MDRNLEDQKNVLLHLIGYNKRDERQLECIDLVHCLRLLDLGRHADTPTLIEI
jgi:uncharacterized protein YbgA (DUF1722 family)